MTCVIKTLEELTKMYGTTIAADGHMRRIGSQIFPLKKQEELCGNTVFCYKSLEEREQWQVPTKTNTWTIEPWMIKEILVE